MRINDFLRPNPSPKRPPASAPKNVPISAADTVNPCHQSSSDHKA